MGCLGVHFAITGSERKDLLHSGSNDALIDYIQETLEEAYFSRCPEFVFQTDKAWDALHRCLSDGKLEVGGGGPLGRAFLGGLLLNAEEDEDDDWDGSWDLWVHLVDTDEVAEVATALAGVTREWLRERYFSLDFPGYSQKGEEDFEYAWDWFQGLPAFFAHAAEHGRAVIFTYTQ